MVRRAKTERVPRTRAGGEWTEAAFWAFQRSNLRLASRKWPPLARLALERVRRPSQSANKRLKWEFQCAECKLWLPRKEVEVDHIIPCGPCSNWDEFRVFAELLFCEIEGLVVLCEQCHLAKTKLDRILRNGLR